MLDRLVALQTPLPGSILISDRFNSVHIPTPAPLMPTDAINPANVFPLNVLLFMRSSYFETFRMRRLSKSEHVFVVSHHKRLIYHLKLVSQISTIYETNKNIVILSGLELRIRKEANDNLRTKA